ncbi:MAG: SAM-dependent DNA methyltransferase [Phycisphaeraceae bacterium]|nr:MAG: SAM-dependent DNA methyltransferase [Phycisphaeraceae bacterium]
MPDPATTATVAGAPQRILSRDELNRLLWGAADILRGTADAGDFKNHILALTMLKRLSDVFNERRAEIIAEWMGRKKTREQAEKIAEDPDEYGDGSFYIPEAARWATLMKVGENRAEAIDVALHAIEEQNGRYLEGVLAGVRFNDERRFGDPKEMDAFMHRLLTHFSQIPLGNRNLAEPDVLGNAYEYLIERFAEGSGKKGGEFYTPRSVVRLIVNLLQPTEGMRIHDPTCGSGGMLIECAHYIEDHGGNARNVTLTGQERNVGTWSICKLNMLLHNVPDADIRPGDTIRNPKFIDGGRLTLFDRVIANPPFSLKDWGHEFVSPEKGGGDPFRRFSRGVPPATKGDLAFLLHMVEVTNDRPAHGGGGGMIGVVMPHGVLFRGAGEGKIRQALLEADLFEAVIGLPEKLFFGTGIPAAVLILNKNKPKARTRKVLFIDASSEGFYGELSNRNDLRLQDVLRIVAVFQAFGDPEFVPARLKELLAHEEASQLAHYERQKKAAALGTTQEAGRLLDELAKEHAKKMKEIEEAIVGLPAWLKAKHPGGRSSLDKFCAVVDLDEIAEENDYNLNISRYVDSSDPAPVLDVGVELKRLRELEKARDAAEKKMDGMLAELGFKAEG